MPSRAVRRWAVCTPLLMAAVCGPADTARAQQQALVYEKELDLKLNPAPPRSDDDWGPLAAEPDASFYEQVVSLPALLSDADADGNRIGRVIKGKPAPPGKWKSAVNIQYGYTHTDGRDVTSWCGASLIDERWVLTAAHCVFRGQVGGLRTLKWVTAYANNVRIQRGLALRVKAAFVHREYDERWLLNDIALLQLDRATNLPRQKLTAGAGQPSFLAPGRMATIVGWGLTKPWWQPGSKPGEGSPVLLEASVPIMDKKVCKEIRDAIPWSKERPPSNGDFCAGYGELEKPSTCNGDSGGPIFVAGGAAGEHIQAGITSHGTIVGCPSIYAGYANVGHYEPWIRKHVPNAVFVMPPSDAPSSPVQQALQQIAGSEPGEPPSPHGQCSVDIRADGAATNRIRVGSDLMVQVTTGVSGLLAVFRRAEGGNKVQLFPNSYRKPVGPAPTAVRAGDVITIPEPRDGFSLKVSPPLGRYEIVAVVAPEGVNLADIARPYEDMGRIADFEGVLARIADETRQVAATAARASRAVCTRQFEVVGQQ